MAGTAHTVGRRSGGRGRGAVDVSGDRWGIRLRRFVLRGGLAFVALAGLFVALIVLGVIPVRAYLTQQRELRDTNARVTMLKAHNNELTTRSARLRTDAEVALIAREQFGMVPAGETLTLLPGLRAESNALMGDGRDAVRPVPPDAQEGHLNLLKAILDLFRFAR